MAHYDYTCVAFVNEANIGTVSSIDVYRGVPTAADVLAIDCATVYADGSVEY